MISQISIIKSDIQDTPTIIQPDSEDPNNNQPDIQDNNHKLTRIQDTNQQPTKYPGHQPSSNQISRTPTTN